MAMTAESLRGPLFFPIDLKNGLIQKPIRSQLMKGDKNANTVVIALTEDKKPVDLSGVTVTGSFISPVEGAEIPLTGSVDGNKASVTLIDECYAEEGYFECHIKLTVGTTSRTILSFTGYVLSKGSGAVIDIGGVIPSIDDIIAQYQAMQEVTESTNAAKNAANAAAKYANDEAKMLDGLTVDAKSTDMPSAEVSVKNGVRHISFGLVTPRITFEVETGAAGTDVEIEQSGTAENPVIKLTIPRGDTGNVEGLDYYEGNPAALGTASPGTANGVARGNHVHPMPSAADVGARPDTWTPSADDVGAVKKTGDTMTGTLTAPGVIVRSSGRYPNVAFRSEEQSESQNACHIEANLEDDIRRFNFSQYHQDMDGAETRYRDNYLLPNATKGLTENKYYNILTTKQPVTIAQGGTDAMTAEEARSNLGAMEDYGRGALLWKGSWSSGNITVTNTSKYLGFKIGMKSAGTTILAMKADEHIRGIGGYSTNEKKIMTYQFTATYSGNVWTLVACNNITHNVSGNHSAANDMVITSIIGLV